MVYVVIWFQLFAGWVVAVLIVAVGLLRLGRLFPALAFMSMVAGYLLGGIALAHWLDISPVWPMLSGLVIGAGALCLLAVMGGGTRDGAPAPERN